MVQTHEIAAIVALAGRHLLPRFIEAVMDGFFRAASQRQSCPAQRRGRNPEQGCRSQQAAQA
jgi:hypothetical protein